MKGEGGNRWTIWEKFYHFAWFLDAEALEHNSEDGYEDVVSRWGHEEEKIVVKRKKMHGNAFQRMQ